MADDLQGTGESIRVLHVDDEPDFADLAETFIGREDDRIEIATATSAREGLDRLAMEDFDCIVSDYDMPGDNGVDFLQAVREEHPNLPFILFTGKGSEEIASEAISAGVTDYLQKRGGAEQYALLANRIVTAVEGYRAQREVHWQRTVIENMGEGVYVCDGSYTIQYVKFRISDIETVSEEDWTGRPVSYLEELGLLRPGEVERIRDGIDRILDGDTDEVRIEVEPTLPESTQVLSLRLTPVQSTDDEDLILITSRDITERVERERQFDAIFNNAYLFLGVMEPDGTLIGANDAVLSFGEVDRDEVVGKRLWDTYWLQSNDESRAAVREGVERARDGELFRDEILVQGSDGEVLVDFAIRPITDDDGDVTLLVPEGRDITDREERD